MEQQFTWATGTEFIPTTTEFISTSTEFISTTTQLTDQQKEYVAQGNTICCGQGHIQIGCRVRLDHTRHLNSRKPIRRGRY